MVGVARAVAGSGDGDASGRVDDAFRFAEVFAEWFVNGVLDAAVFVGAQQSHR